MMHSQKKEKVHRIATQNQQITNEYPLKSRLFAISTNMMHLQKKEKVHRIATQNQQITNEYPL